MNLEMVSDRRQHPVKHLQKFRILMNRQIVSVRRKHPLEAFLLNFPNSPSLQPTAVAAICDEKEEQKEDNYCEQHQEVKTRNIFRRYCNISNHERCLQQFVFVAKFDQTVL